MGLFDLFDDTTDTSSTTTVNLRNMDELNRGQGKRAELGGNLQEDQLKQLMALLGRGGQAQAEGDIDAARAESMTLMDMLRGAQGGPSKQNILQGQKFAQQIFAPQQQALQQQFQQAETDTSRLAARLGRQVDDPILRAKLAQAQGQQVGQLQAQQGAFAAQSAQGFQTQALDLQNQLAGIRGGLATQALQNRQALMGMGQSLLSQERQFRLASAGQQTVGQQTNQGGFGDFLGATMAGAGTVGKLMGMGGFAPGGTT